MEGVPHHVTQRGNGRRQVFDSELDYGLYRDLLREYAQQYGLEILAYCLMPNHTHLVCVPGREDTLSRTLGRTHADFARHFNISRQSCGHLWQARFFSCPLDGQHLWCAMAYVERNPVRAGLAREAWDYRWSSAAMHVGLGADDPLAAPFAAWQDEYGPARWRDVLRGSVVEEGMAQRIREATRCGWPLGSEAFVTDMEQRTQRRLHPMPPGRPRKDKTGAKTTAADGRLKLEMRV
jgi:putative transposase